MATQIQIKRGSTTPAGLTVGESAMNTSTNQIYLGGTGGTVLVGGEVTGGVDMGAGSAVSANRIPTQSGVYNYVRNSTVTSFNGATGAVGGVTTSAANTFTALQSFSAGISAAGGITFANDISVNNLTIGQGPVLGSNNTAIGEFALAALQSGAFSNTAVGAYALASATAGDNNVAIGDSVMNAATNAGNNNVAIGAFALNNNAGGSDNIAIGNFALSDNRSGQYNVVIGNDALDGNQTGNRNTAIGYSSLAATGNTANSDNLAIGSYSLLSLNSGTQNTAIGAYAGRRRGTGISTLLSATGGIYIGYDARASANAQTNEIVIGNTAVGLGSNTAVIGQNTQTSATIYGLVNAPSGISASGATFSGNIFAPNIVNSFNGSTGAVQGVSAAVGSTYLTVSGSTGSVTFTNTGVQTFNGATGAVTGVASIGGFTGTVTVTDGTYITVRKSSNDITFTNTGVQTFNGLTGAVLADAVTWSVITADTTAVVNRGYFTNKATVLGITLPSTAAVGSVLRVSGMTASGWKITQNASGVIHFGKTDTTVGTSGYLQSTLARDGVELVCCVANNEWNVVSSVGNITIA